jgi:Fe-S cluster biogenesis protein NfuA
METRVREALAQVEPLVKAHGGSVALVDVENGVIRVRVEYQKAGCASTAATLRRTVEQSIYDKAPDAAGVLVEGLPETGAAPSFVPLTAVALRDRSAVT